MSVKPLVAVVGRPNVGKSTFFNKIAGQRIAIVEDIPGVTRDRVCADCEWLSHRFTLIDTGGIDPRSTDPLRIQMRHQAEIAMEMADVILFFVDGKQGLTADDADVANMLRRAGAPVLLVVNKIDSPAQMDNQYDFYSLGMDDPIAISSTNMMGLGDLLDVIVSHFPAQQEEAEEDPPIHIAVVGRPNVGKSTLVNRLLGQDRVMVSDIPGTTRDAIDAPFERDGQRYNIIDTAGIRRKRAIEEDSLERYSVVRSLAAVRRCDVALILLDANDGVTEQDTKIAGFVEREGKAAVVVVNKWDIVEKDTSTMEAMRKQVLSDLKFMDWAPVLFLSALTGARTQKLLQAVNDAYAMSCKRVTTGVLNDILADAQLAQQTPASGGRRLKIYYGTQQSTQPPTFVLFVNDETLMHFAYQRYLENQFRKAFGFEGTPIRFVLREKNKEES
ncbi:MAG TPA: ribosome biogenesis GTPase Der [Candidatus Aphodomonas merdavium]|nr:ribosome biogenesis GTPase Der [Candidatus Aphodomonas merdavium]